MVEEAAIELELSPRERAEIRRTNRILSFLPRLRFTPLRVRAIQSVVGLAARVADLLARETGVTVETRQVEALGRSARVRILRPQGPSRGVHIDLHGGAWAVGAAHVDDPLNLRLARATGRTVVSIDYRLVPDVTIAEVIDDCETAAAWVLATQDGPVTIGGESAGAHLAACTLLRLRERGLAHRIAGAVLLYGIYDLSGTPSLRAAGRDTLVFDGPTATIDLAMLAPDLDEAGRRAPALSPLHADLAGLPPALLVVGTADPLIDDTRLFAAAWQRANANAELLLVPDCPHAFNRLDTAIAERVNGAVRRWLRAR